MLRYNECLPHKHGVLHRKCRCHEWPFHRCRESKLDARNGLPPGNIQASSRIRSKNTVAARNAASIDKVAALVVQSVRLAVQKPRLIVQRPPIHLRQLAAPIARHPRRLPLKTISRHRFHRQRLKSIASQLLLKKWFRRRLRFRRLWNGTPTIEIVSQLRWGLPRLLQNRAPRSRNDQLQFRLIPNHLFPNVLNPLNQMPINQRLSRKPRQLKPHLATLPAPAMHPLQKNGQ